MYSLDIVKKEKYELTQKFSEADLKIKALDLENAELKHSVDQITQERNKITQDMNNCKDELNTALTRANSKIAQLEGDIAAMESCKIKCNLLEKEQNDYKIKIRELESEVSNNKQNETETDNGCEADNQSNYSYNNNINAFEHMEDQVEYVEQLRTKYDTIYDMSEDEKRAQIFKEYGLSPDGLEWALNTTNDLNKRRMKQERDCRILEIKSLEFRNKQLQIDLENLQSKFEIFRNNNTELKEKSRNGNLDTNTF